MKNRNDPGEDRYGAKAMSAICAEYRDALMDKGFSREEALHLTHGLLTAATIATAPGKNNNTTGINMNPLGSCFH